MLLDTSAWIEFFQKTDAGRIVKGHLESGVCATALPSFAEISQWAKRQDINPVPLFEQISLFSEILPLDRGICLLAGDINHLRKRQRKKWGLLDSFVLATALAYRRRVLTADSDFRDIPSATVLERSL